MKLKKTILLALAVGAVFCIAAGIGAFCRFEYGSPSKTCSLCHEIRGAHDRWAKSPHRNVNCKDCHGGTLEAFSDNLTRAEKHFRGADYAREDVSERYRLISSATISDSEALTERPYARRTAASFA